LSEAFSQSLTHAVFCCWFVVTDAAGGALFLAAAFSCANAGVPAITAAKPKDAQTTAIRWPHRPMADEREIEYAME
jgi:hypothetical protein